MGNNTHKELKPEQRLKLSEKFSAQELQMLWMIFEDLSSRDYGVINKETFLKFFPLTGLWGERLFEKFDLNHTTFLTFFEFAYGIAQCCKSSEEEKIKLLFSLYDFDNDGYIEKKEMITMLYNYPKNHIKFITDEIAPDNGEKLEQITEARREASIANLDALDVDHVVPISSPQEMSIMQDHPKSNEVDEIKPGEDLDVPDEDKKADQLFPVDRDIKKSYDYYKKSEEKKRRESEILSLKNLTKNGLLEIPKIGPNARAQTRINKPITMIDLDNVPQAKERRKISENQSIKPTRAMSSAMNQISPLNPLRVHHSLKVSGSTIIMDQSFVQSTTINTRVKEYAAFMFKTFEGANVRGKISFSEFREWLTMHPIILRLFDETFHQDIWSVKRANMNFASSQSTGAIASQQSLDKADNIKIGFQLRKPDIEGIMYKKGKKTKAWQSRYYELREDFLFYYSKKGASLPKGVHFLEGCYIEEMNDFAQTHKYGFKITHKNEGYEPHCLYITKKDNYDEWMSHLKSFRSTSIQDMYSFQEKIGTGKFSIVYRAVSKKDNTSEYAIKVIEKGGLKPEEREFVLSETTVMKVLNHPQVIKLIETIETKTTIYIVTELVKDGDLFEYIVNRDFLEEYESSYIMKQLLVAFHYLDGVEIVHRDIKPENIMITLTDDKTRVKEIKIIDFGFAKFLTPGVMLYETCGTPNYVAPEVLKGAGYNKRVDIWGLGIIMYLMLRGRLPFDSHNVDEILRNTLRCEIPMDEEHWDNISADGKDLLLKLLQKDQNRRITIKEALRHPWITERERLKLKIGSNKRDFDPINLTDGPTGIEHADP